MLKILRRLRSGAVVHWGRGQLPFPKKNLGLVLKHFGYGSKYAHRPYSFVSCEVELYKKLSYRTERAHLTLLYRTVQKAFRYVEPFTRGSRV